jgi:hypothetical protein
MPKFVIEREIPGAGKWTPEEKRAIAQKSNSVIEEIGHAELAGFPANRVSAVRFVVDPATAEG